MIEAISPGKAPGIYSQKEAVERSGLNPIIFSWIVRVEHVELPRLGKRAVYTDATIARVLEIYNARDPEGRFLTRPGRKNGPSKKKERCKKCGKRWPQEYKVRGMCAPCAVAETEARGVPGGTQGC